MALPPDLENKERTRPEGVVTLGPPPRSGKSDPSGYQPDRGLANALRVALLLRKPLLVTGQPGTGKTDLAWYVSWKLRHDKDPLVFEAKSTSVARDLFYTYNTLERFVQHDASKRAADYIVYNALGEAFLQTSERGSYTDILPSDFSPDGPRQSVVLIDEVDKAPRDFPNDILNELDRHFFRIPELGNRKVTIKDGFEPILIITSNSEKSLPAAFLRRCIYYNIPQPDEARLRLILSSRLAEFPMGQAMADDALSFFLRLRDTKLLKTPATAELLDWLLYLKADQADLTKPLRQQPDLARKSLSALVKHQDDQTSAEDMLKAWLSGSSTG
jgi:MoxR-like ATPase